MANLVLFDDDGNVIPDRTGKNDLISKETLRRELAKELEHRIKWTQEDCNELSLTEIERAIERCSVHIKE